MDAGAVHSKLIQVKSGDIIFGNMTKTGSDSWFINGVDLETNENATLSITRAILKTQPWVYVTLEVYDVTSCEQYPPSGTEMPYTNLVLYESGNEKPISWTVGTDGQSPPVCDAKIAVKDASDVTITF